LAVGQRITRPVGGSRGLDHERDGKETPTGVIASFIVALQIEKITHPTL
jgi:hypothetical protein